MENCEPAYGLEKTQQFLNTFCIDRNGAVAAVHKESGKVIDYAFSEGKAHKIFAETIDDVKSVSLMRKLGMKPEGVQRRQVRDPRGRWADLYLYGLLEDDWRQTLRES